MKTVTPKITVLMSVHNGERHLKESIESILEQDYRDFEFIIINDGSTDKTKEILESYDDPRIKLINQEQAGLTISLNRGLKIAGGELIARMDADDVSAPQRFGQQMELMDENPSIGLSGISGDIIDDSGHFLRKVNHPLSHKDIMEKILLDNRFIHSSLMIRKSLFDKWGYYDETLNMVQDYALILRLSTVTKFCNIEGPLHSWRENTLSGISVKKRMEQIQVRDKIRKNFFSNKLPFNRENTEWAIKNLTHNFNDPMLNDYISEAYINLSWSYENVTTKMKILYYMGKRKVLKLIQ